jgi:tripartite-type tricarboxylate transporter receptor subunit TctC
MLFSLFNVEMMLMTRLSRRTMLSAALAAFAGSVPGVLQRASAQAGYPTRVIKMIVPWPPGGVTDSTGRILAQQLGAELGQTVIVENRGGAAGTVGHAYASHADADGYTILLATNSTYAMAPHLMDKLTYDSEKAFVPVGLVLSSPQVFCVHPSVPVKDMREFLDYVRARQPSGVTYESSGPGSSSHLATELLMSMAKFGMLHVPYRGGGPALLGLMAGEVNCGFVDAVVAMPMAEAGKIKMLGVSTKERLPLAMELPTISEAGVPGFQSSTDVSLLVPTGTPQAIIHKLSAALLATLKFPQARDALLKQGAIIVAGTPEQYPPVARHQDAVVKSRAAQTARLLSIKPDRSPN